MRSPLPGGAVAAALVAAALAQPLHAQDGTREAQWRAAHQELPRWPDKGVVPDDPFQRLQPFALDARGSASSLGMGVGGDVGSPPEYAPVDGVLFRYGAGWNSVVTECVAKLTGDPQYDERALVLLFSAGQEATATAQFVQAGADMSKVDFVVMPGDSIWARDYGPHFVFKGGARAIVDSHYYPERPKDNFVPTLLAEDHLQVPAFPMGLYYSGGNFQPGPAASGFTTSLVYQDNPGFTDAEIAGLYRIYQGIDTLHILPRLPSSVDGTGHIDMWLYLVDDDSVMISEFIPGSNPTAIQVTNDAVPYMQALGFQVTRVPAWNVGYTHFTYTNAFRVNDRIFVPVYGGGHSQYLDEDAAALAAWQAAAGPNVELVPIECSSIIPAAGAIHCIVMQIPRYDDIAPAVAILDPAGGELLVTGTERDLLWVADDDVGVEAVNLAYSVDGGASFPYVIAPRESDDGQLSWTVPTTESDQVVVRAMVGDADGNAAAAATATFEIARERQHVYDFTTSAGVDRWGWGFQTPNWGALEGVRYPASASTEIEVLVPGAYDKIARPDAEGGDGDAARYVSPNPANSQESTHVFEFVLAEDPASILDIELLWEGYGDQCLQMELYVWDRALGNWGDGRGRAGENRYVAAYAGNRDDALVGNIRSDFARYVDAEGKLTLLLYAERSKQESFHDYLSVTVTHE